MSTTLIPTLKLKQLRCGECKWFIQVVWVAEKKRIQHGFFWLYWDNSWSTNLWSFLAFSIMAVAMARRANYEVCCVLSSFSGVFISADCGWKGAQQSPRGRPYTILHQKPRQKLSHWTWPHFRPQEPSVHTVFSSRRMTTGSHMVHACLRDNVQYLRTVFIKVCRHLGGELLPLSWDIFTSQHVWHISTYYNMGSTCLWTSG